MVGLSLLAACSGAPAAAPRPVAPLAAPHPSTSTSTVPETDAEAATATVLRWVDGDTLEVQLGAGEPTTVRLEGVDTPEFRSYGGANECVDAALAGRAAARAEAMAPVGTAVELTVDGTDRYGRTLALVATAEGDIGERLVAEAVARRWPDGACPA